MRGKRPNSISERLLLIRENITLFKDSNKILFTINYLNIFCTAFITHLLQQTWSVSTTFLTLKSETHCINHIIYYRKNVQICHQILIKDLFILSVKSLIYLSHYRVKKYIFIPLFFKLDFANLLKQYLILFNLSLNQKYFFCSF